MRHACCQMLVVDTSHPPRPEEPAVNATVIPFPTTAADGDLLELEAHLLEVYSGRLEELDIEASPDADPRLVGRMRELADYCDRLAGAAGPDDADVDGALEEAGDLLEEALLAITRASVRRLLGTPLLDRLDEGLMLASAFATICHLDHVAIDLDGERVAEHPLDRMLLRRFMRAVARGYVFARERAPLDVEQRERLRGALVDLLADAVEAGEPRATTVRDVLAQLHGTWVEEMAPDVRAEIAVERADATPERGTSATAVQRAFDVGVACSVARRFLDEAAEEAALRVPTGTDPAEWLSTLTA